MSRASVPCDEEATTCAAELPHQASVVWVWVDSGSALCGRCVTTYGRRRTDCWEA